MSCVSTNPRRPGAAYTLLEVMVALLVTMIFIGGVYTTFIQISKGHQVAQARMNAMNSARTALSSMSADIKTANRLGGNVHFVGVDAALPYGDGVDNDGDGAVDEETVNGMLDQVTTATEAQLDRHARLRMMSERPLQVGRVDLGDSQVDVDAVFGRDVLEFFVKPEVPTPEMINKIIRYYVDDFEGEHNVLLRETWIVPEADNPQISVTPLAFGVAGLDMLYWDPNAQPQDQGWLPAWNSDLASAFPFPKLAMPGAVYIRLTMFTDPRPAETIQAGQPVEVTPVETIVNLEEIIHDAMYPRPNL